jgi:hypothetical protein
MRYRRNRRPALTLLEMVLTFAIAMVVLLALFMIMQSQYNHAQAGREVIDEAGLARSILTRIAADISGSLGPVDPRFLPNGILPNNANAKPTGGMAAVAMASNTPTAVSATGATASTTTAASSAAASSTTTSSSASSSVGMTPAPFNLGVKGDAKWLVLSVNRVPAALIASPKAPVTDNSIVSSDLRSLSIWLVDGMGLARSETSAVTGDAAPTGQPDFSDPQQYVFAPEVVDIEFKYFDGVDWLTSWDGGQLGGNDGNTPIGPPLAIRIRLTLRRGPAARPGDDANTDTVSYVHVVTLPASNGFTQAVQSGSGAPTGGQSLIPALQAGQQIPAANSQSTGTTSGM